MYFGSEGRSVKAICRKHARCVCWVTKYSGDDDIHKDLVAWLALASGEAPQNLYMHKRESQILKAKYGMRVEVPPLEPRGATRSQVS